MHKLWFRGSAALITLLFYGHDPRAWSFLKCFWRASTWFHHSRYFNGTIHIIDNVILLSDLVESSGYSSKTLQKGSCTYAPLNEVLRYVCRCILRPENMCLYISEVFIYKFHVGLYTWFVFFCRQWRAQRKGGGGRPAPPPHWPYSRGILK